MPSRCAGTTRTCSAAPRTGRSTSGLEAAGWRPRQTLGRIAARDAREPEDRRERNGLCAVLVKPVRLAGRPEHEAQALADLLAADVGDWPDDLAMVQFALTRAWDARAAQGDDLLRTCAKVGRVEGALAAAAARILEMSRTRCVADAAAVAAAPRLRRRAGAASGSRAPRL